MRILVTGSSGLIGSTAVRYFYRQGHQIAGIDNNGRKEFFGPDADTKNVAESLKRELGSYFNFHNVDIADYESVKRILWSSYYDLVIHCAAQPSHDKSASNPIRDFQVNAVGTLNLLENLRQSNKKASFIFCSTNKVYGDGPNYIPSTEEETRYEYDPPDYKGVNSQLVVTSGMGRTIHTPFGVSKLSADFMVQEYANYFGMNTVCFRLGCVTGPSQQGVELHGFLNYLCKCAKEDKEFVIYGWRGKQVRDIIHAEDVVKAFEIWAKAPTNGGVFNLGGGKENSVSVLEAIAMVEELTGKEMKIKYSEQARKGDHKLYYTDNSWFKICNPKWEITRNLKSILEEMLGENSSTIPRQPETD